MCEHAHGAGGLAQSLREMDFERGVSNAGRRGDVGRLLALLSAGHAVDEPDAYGYTALHYACSNGDVQTVRFLLTRGASPNAATSAGKVTPLHRAAMKGHVEIVGLLLNSGADAAAVDADGLTAADRSRMEGHTDVQALMLAQRDQCGCGRQNMQT
eukprot:CAMPEP_0177635414 /NCGR_PEP_ID=MMETSP0447-20121125/3889_1 /TAXON_ID=0 /ORGANISM="Stygamoeba regulata, Strain BSH-02190019" /LENGTH=155 /DNA_ID=CAMNT_0019137201 /DNA_START=100 /DNA_END=567 /DNA_ORIENTATION=-